MRKIGRNRRVWQRSLAWLAAMLFPLVILSGCGGTLDTLLKQDDITGKDLDQWIGTSDNLGNPAVSSGGEAQTVSLYFADGTGKYLVKEERTIPKTLSLARETVNQWLMGPAIKDNTVQAVVSPNTSLRDISLRDGVLTVDLSQEFTQPYGSIPQEVTLYGLVNTLTQFSTVDSVKLRVDGKELTKLGSLSLDSLTYKETLVKDSTSAPVSTTTIEQNQNPPASGSNNDGKNSGDGGSTSGSPSSINIFSTPL